MLKHHRRPSWIFQILMILLGMMLALPTSAATPSMGHAVYSKASATDAYGSVFSGYTVGDIVVLRRNEAQNYCFGKRASQPNPGNDCRVGVTETTAYQIPPGVTKHYLEGFCWDNSLTNCKDHPQTYDIDVALSGTVVTVTISAGTHFSISPAGTLDFTIENGKATALPTPPLPPYKVPPTHPTLIFTDPAVQAKAKAWFNATFSNGTSFNPKDEELDEWAFGYLMTNREEFADKLRVWLSDPVRQKDLIDSLTGCGESGCASDPLRWYGEYAALACDWVPIDSKLCGPWTGYMEIVNPALWGGPVMPGNNYFWGWLRSDIEFGLTNYLLDQKRNQALLDEALDRRHTGSMLPYSRTGEKGGVLAEGFHYGRYQLGYSAIPYWSMRLLGRDLYSENRFYKEAVYYLIYLSTPKPTPNITPKVNLETHTIERESTAPGHIVFPYNDDEDFKDARLDSDLDWEKNIGKFLASAANEWAQEPTGQYARRLLQLAKIPVPSYLRALDVGGAARDFNSLPLDYYAAGTSYLFSRNQWGVNATSLFFQLSSPTGVGHSHLDAGTFQIWRKGRWLSRESAGNSESLRGFAMEGVMKEGVTHSENAIVHNSLLINGQGPGEGLNPNPDKGESPVTRLEVPSPVVTRLESAPNYSFSSVDLSASYSLHNERANQNVSHVVRDFLFIRPLETLLVFDRMESRGAPSQIPDAAQVAKTFLVHFEMAPHVLDAHHVLYTSGNQALHVSTLYPTSHTFKVIDEAIVKPDDESSVYLGQFRLEDTTQGSARSYFIHTLQARDKSAPNLTTSVTETETAFKITLSHPSRGRATLTLRKGMVSRGGSFGYAASGTPISKPLLEGIEPFDILDSGPRWGPAN